MWQMRVKLTSLCEIDAYFESSGKLGGIAPRGVHLPRSYSPPFPPERSVGCAQYISLSVVLSRDHTLPRQ